MNRNFQWYIVHIKIFSIFTHKSNRFCLKNMPMKPIAAKNPRNDPSPGARGPPSNMPIPWLTPLTTQMTAQSVCAVSCNCARKSTLVTLRHPKFSPNCLFPVDNHHPLNTAVPRPTPHTTPNGVWIQSTILPQYTFQMDKQTDKLVGDLVRKPPLSKFRGLPFRNKGLNQNSVETPYAGNVGHHYTKISENWIKNCRRSSISRDTSENEVFRSQFRR